MRFKIMRTGDCAEEHHWKFETPTGWSAEAGANLMDGVEVVMADEFDAVVAERDEWEAVALGSQEERDKVLRESAPLYDRIDVLEAENTRLTAERDALKRWQTNVIEREAACCPEDVGFDEYIQHLRTRLTQELDALCGKTDGHPEDFCHRCGGRNIGWYADSDLWNRLDPPESIICPICFVIEAENSGVKTSAWRVAPGDESPEAQRLLTRLHESRDRVASLTAELEAAREYSKKLEGRCGNLTQELKQLKSGWNSEEKYKQIAQSRRGDRRAVVRKLLKAEQALRQIASLELIQSSVDTAIVVDHLKSIAARALNAVAANQPNQPLKASEKLTGRD